MTNSIITFESIKRQNDDFFNDLTASVARLRKSGDFTTDSVKKSHISQVIKQHTKINTLIYMDHGLNASVYPPYITANHVFLRNGTAASSIIDVTKTDIKGKVDIENVKVHGVFAEKTSEILLGVDFFKPGRFTDDEIAAAILHEVGHIFTCWQFMSTMAFGALVINQTINNIFLTDDYQTKEIVIRAAEEVLGLEGDKEIEDWVDTSKENVEIILNTRFVRSLRTRTNSAYYDVRNCEQLADTFAAKHGAGVALARLTNKLHNAYGSYGNPNFFAHMLTQTASLLKVIKPFSHVSLSDILYTLDQPKRYDDPKDRIAFIKYQLIDDLKRIPAGNKELRTNMLASIDDINALLKKVIARKSVFQAIHDTFTISGKSASNQQIAIKKLESMLYNDLFLQSAKLKNLH